MNRTTLLVAVAAVVLGGLVGVALLVQIPTAPETSEYGYSVTVATNATLTNVTFYLPYPATAGGESPFDAVFETEDGETETGAFSVPDGWRVTPVETDHGRMLRVTASEVPTRVRSDGHAYETYTLEASAPADDAVDTGEPFETEPLLRPASGFETVPCPNQGSVPSGSTCHVFESRLYASYDAPEHADVDVFVVAGGANDLDGDRGNWYSERVITRLEGARGGWVEVGGDLQTGAGTAR